MNPTQNVTLIAASPKTVALIAFIAGSAIASAYYVGKGVGMLKVATKTQN